MPKKKKENYLSSITQGGIPHSPDQPEAVMTKVLEANRIGILELIFVKEYLLKKTWVMIMYKLIYF